MVDILNPPDILLKSISVNEQNNGPEKEVYFYHGDHLGSANWITDVQGLPIQYIHYAPYGELITNQSAAGYDERYKFTGKERDAESGYDAFGARYYSSIFGHFTSPDPISDKYPNISPYAYCGWNPVKFVDPDGREKHIFLSKDDSYAAKNFRDDNGIYIFGHGNSGPDRYVKNEADNSLGQDLPATKISDYIINHSEQYKNDEANGNTSMVFLYVCHAGEGDNSVAWQLSEQLNSHETYVIGPMDVLTSSSSSGKVNQKYDKIENGRPWGVYKDGKLVTTINGKIMPTRTSVERKLFFYNLLKSIKNFFKNENE